MTSNNPESDLRYARFTDRLLEGRRSMAHLIHVWHESNGWSHKVLPALAESLDIGRLHGSQISNLRNGKLAAPSPEVFFALAQANAVLHKGIDSIKDRLADIHPELLKVLQESALPLLGDNDQPIGAGQFFEIFIGLASLPSSFDWLIEVDEAIELSAALADCFCHGRSWRQCREEILKAYPVMNVQRRERFAEVIAGVRDYNSEEFASELLDLTATYKELTETDKGGANVFLKELRNRASILKN